MTSVSPLQSVLYEPLLRRSFEEDLGRAGDVTTDGILGGDDVQVTGRIAARQGGYLAGVDVAARAFAMLDGAVNVEIVKRDGAAITPGDVLLELSGSARSILTAERTALNLMGRMSGIATATGVAVSAIEGTDASIVCTRKTTPGLRMLEKYAVRCGGGANHRFGLDDAALVKDNHIAAAGGIVPAVTRLRAHVGHMMKIEVEVDTLDQLRELIPLGVDAVLLDNMSPQVLAEAVAMVNGAMITEASGGITPETVRAVAEAGVDLISLGWLTHSVTNLDVGLDFDNL